MNTRLHRLIRLSIFLATLACATSTSAGTLDTHRLYLAAQDEIPWKSLSPEEQDALSNSRSRWNKFGGERQEQIRKGARRFMSLPPESRDKIKQQRKHYRQLSPKEQQRLKEKYQRNKH